MNCYSFIHLIPRVPSIYAKCSCRPAAPSTPYLFTSRSVSRAVFRFKNIKNQNTMGNTPCDHPTGIIAVPAVMTAMEYFCRRRKPPVPLMMAYTVEHREKWTRSNTFFAALVDESWLSAALTTLVRTFLTSLLWTLPAAVSPPSNSLPVPTTPILATERTRYRTDMEQLLGHRTQRG